MRDPKGLGASAAPCSGGGCWVWATRWLASGFPDQPPAQPTPFARRSPQDGNGGGPAACRAVADREAPRVEPTGARPASLHPHALAPRALPGVGWSQSGTSPRQGRSGAVGHPSASPSLSSSSMCVRLRTAAWQEAGSGPEVSRGQVEGGGRDGLTSAPERARGGRAGVRGPCRGVTNSSARATQGWSGKAAREGSVCPASKQSLAQSRPPAQGTGEAGVSGGSE